jgi:hypothetical protein
MSLVLRRGVSSSTVMLGKFSKAPTSSGSLSQKRMPSGWYKGSGTPTLGFHTRKGRFVVQHERVPRVAVPVGLATTDLKPYVSKRTPLLTEPAAPTFEQLRDELIAQSSQAPAVNAPSS